MRASLVGLGLITVACPPANWAFLQGLGLQGLAPSEAPATDLARRAIGRGGASLMVGIVTPPAVSTINAILIAGARTTCAAVRDLGQAAPRLAALGRWHPRRGVPTAPCRMSQALKGEMAAPMLRRGTTRARSM